MKSPHDYWGKESRSATEREFLSGPQSRWKEFKWATQIFFECIKGFRKLHFVGPCVTVFGSARTPEHAAHYRLAQETGQALAEAGFTVMTGGGPGIMEGANRGAKEAGGPSVGCNITLPSEQRPNRFLDVWVEFKFFMIRKIMLAKYSYGFIALPGGFGTLDELFGILTLIQTKKIENFPVVLMDREFWGPLRQQIDDRFRKEKTINEVDGNLIFYTDSPQEAVQHIVNLAVQGYKLKLSARPKPQRLLGEFAPGVSAKSNTFLEGKI